MSPAPDTSNMSSIDTPEGVLDAGDPFVQRGEEMLEHARRVAQEVDDRLRRLIEEVRNLASETDFDPYSLFHDPADDHQVVPM
jgi:hypothetical protein